MVAPASGVLSRVSIPPSAPVLSPSCSARKTTRVAWALWGEARRSQLVLDRSTRSLVWPDPSDPSQARTGGTATSAAPEAASKRRAFPASQWYNEDDTIDPSATDPVTSDTSHRPAPPRRRRPSAAASTHLARAARRARGSALGDRAHSHRGSHVDPAAPSPDPTLRLAQPGPVRSAVSARGGRRPGPCKGVSSRDPGGATAVGCGPPRPVRARAWRVAIG